MTPSPASLVDWRRRVHEMYADVRAGDGPADVAHARWRAARDELFATHPQSPLPADDPLRRSGIPCWPYDPELRFEVPIEPAETEDRVVDAGSDGSLTMQRVGRVTLPGPIDASLDVWSLQQYGGGLFLPLRDGTAGDGSYGGGRYLLDTTKGAWLGGDDDALVVDLNYAYHPSCRYDPAWQCPLAPPGNTITARVEAGERL